MLLRVVSDLHTEFWYRELMNGTFFELLNESVIPEKPEDKETTLLICGDIGLGHKKETWLKPLEVLSSRFREILFCGGNHFFYDNNLFEGFPSNIKINIPNVHLLEYESIVIDDVLFIGATMWSDLNPKNSEFSTYDIQTAVRYRMNDYVCIMKQNSKEAISINQTMNRFIRSKNYIYHELKNSSCDKTVVMTHHGPSFKEMNEDFRGNILNHAYFSDLDNMIEELGKPNYWFFGHTHDTLNYTIGKTTIRTNPFGYYPYQTNKSFDPNLTIEI